MDVKREQLRTAFEDRPEWFATFLGATTQKLVIVGHVLKALGQEYSPSLVKLKEGNTRVNILGGGNGEAELQILRTLSDFGADFSIHYEDPSLEMHSLFDKNVKAVGLSEKVGSKSSLTLEDPAYIAPHNNLTFGLHMFYYVKGWNDPDNSSNPLIKVKDSISPEGVGLIIIQSSKSDNYIFRNRFLPQVHGSPVKAAYGEQITDSLDQLGVAHSHEVVPCYTFVDCCFTGTNGEFNPDDSGKRLLSFLLRKDWDSVPKTIQTDVAEHLTESVTTVGYKKAMVFRDSFIWIPGDGYDSS